LKIIEIIINVNYNKTSLKEEIVNLAKIIDSRIIDLKEDI